MNKEIWKDIKEFPCYKISNCGRIRSRKQSRPKILKSTIGWDGYYQVSLYKLDKQFRFYVHRLVLETFVGPCPLGYQTNHKNGIKTDNQLENLEWITPSENMKHAYQTGLKTHKGIMHPGVKLRDKDVLEIRRLAEDGITQDLLSIVFNVHYSTISRIVHYKRWNHI